MIILFGGTINIDVINFMTTNKKIPIQRELDFNYTTLVFNKTNKAGSDIKRKWITYEKILDELSLMGEFKKIDEIKYRITDGEDDKSVFKDVLKKIKEKGIRLNLLTNSI